MVYTAVLEAVPETVASSSLAWGTKFMYPDSVNGNTGISKISIFSSNLNRGAIFVGSKSIGADTWL
jgi:hypothetical protein